MNNVLKCSSIRFLFKKVIRFLNHNFQSSLDYSGPKNFVHRIERESAKMLFYM